jgi:hypothetical protein
MYTVNVCNGQHVERFRNAERAYRAFTRYARTGCPVFLSDTSYPDEDSEIASSGYGESRQPDTAARKVFFA